MKLKMLVVVLLTFVFVGCAATQNQETLAQSLAKSQQALAEAQAATRAATQPTVIPATPNQPAIILPPVLTTQQGRDVGKVLDKVVSVNDSAVRIVTADPSVQAEVTAEEVAKRLPGQYGLYALLGLYALKEVKGFFKDKKQADNHAAAIDALANSTSVAPKI